MNLQLLPIGKLDGGLLTTLAPVMADTFGLPCEILPTGLDPQFAFHGERQQYHSSEILAPLQQRVSSQTWRILGVTAVDLYIPILTFVFGEAQVGGPCALVSFHRLRQEFYGLPADKDLLLRRLLKESVHEIGHTLNLTHCDDYRCAMAPSHAVEWIDLKESSLCSTCHGRIFEKAASSLGH
jgi:archaemetzincin